MSAVKHRAEGTPEECRERKRRETVADSSVEDGEVEAEVAVAAEPSIQAPASVAAIAVVSNAPSFLTTRVETDKFPGSCDVRQCVVRDEIICGILSDRSCVDLYKLGPIAASDRGSTVYKSTEIGSNRVVAVKKHHLKPGHDEGDDVIAFKREAVIHDVMGLSRRPHPNLCHMIDALVAPDGYFTVFPFVEGMLLDKYIQRKPGGRLSPEEAKWLFTQLLSGLKRIHDIGVVHLDLKAENIFVSPAPVQTSPVVEEAAVAPYQEAALLERTDNHLVLIDFGVSSPFPNPWKKRFVISRLREYMPPELHRKEDSNGFQCDLWAAGVNLFHMLVGCLPYTWPTKARDTRVFDATIPELIAAKRGPRFPVPPDAVALLSRLLHPNPRLRISLDDALAHSWLCSPGPALAAGGTASVLAAGIGSARPKSSHGHKDPASKPRV